MVYNRFERFTFSKPPALPEVADTQTFGYDELNRLTSAQAAAYGTISYSYNEIGNMMSNSQIGSYNYPTNGIRPHAVTTAGSNSYIYDDNGNMTAGAGRTIRYNYDNRPIAVTAGGSTTTFMYDANGSRVKKTANGLSTIYIGKLYENTSDGCVKYIFAGDQRIAMRDATGALFYYHTDHLGSSSVITNAAGVVVENLAYFPYGQLRINTGTKDVHYKFTGQELDAETGLYFYGARYYDPQLGRFISADTIVPNPRNPQDMNRYSYVSNNPLNYIDPTGHKKWWKQALGVVEMAAGAVLVAIGEGSPISYAGAALMTHGAHNFGANVDVSVQVETYSWGGPSSVAEVNTSSMDVNITNMTISQENKQYAEAYTSDAQYSSSVEEINLLAQLTFAEAAMQYEIPNVMEGIAWSVRNRVEANKPWFGGDTYFGVIYKAGQYQSVGGNLWNKVGNPDVLTGRNARAYDRALTVSNGVYYGTISDPTGGATYFHSIPSDRLKQESPWFHSAVQKGTLKESIPPIGPFYFYK